MVARIFLIILFLAAIAGIGYGRWQWTSKTKSLQIKLEQLCVRAEGTPYDLKELDELPAPVQRYFRAVLRKDQRMIASVTVEHSGFFNMSEQGEQWKPFTSHQRVIIQRSGFLWDARINMIPGISVFVRDACIGGKGILCAKLFGILTLMDYPGGSELDQGELMRFLAESAWYPTALLPRMGIRWKGVNNEKAIASLTDDKTTVSLEFQFDEQGLIVSARSDERFRIVHGKAVPTPWECRFSNYDMRDGMRIPLEGEVAWLLPDGPKPYWRGRIERIQFDYRE